MRATDPSASFTPSHSTEAQMRIVLNLVGLLLLLAGGVWFLQGINVIPGSYMTGQTKWALIGAICLVAGLAALFLANRRRM